MELTEIGRRAREVSHALNNLGPDQKNQGLYAASEAILSGRSRIKALILCGF